jgi:calpain
MMYVLIDDRMPVNQSNGKLIFGKCKDPNELWVPLIEKAYAKLHGSYKALIKGYAHNALGDLSGKRTSF